MCGIVMNEEVNVERKIIEAISNLRRIIHYI